MSVLRSEATGGQFLISIVVLMTRLILIFFLEAALFLQLHGRDGRTQGVTATIPFTNGSGNGTHAGGEILPHVKLVCD